ncbi:lytic polysaccharide monooxygenase [Rhizocola hellebori]|uniref:lytic polysaccharide monooxygenase n=1 Tax=Rhizocola hellebori TaxID=1392758 RepID=UPI00194503E2|nr:lytic polysaccharide monooxygenase [Rhizocola hellebori]
MQPHVRVAAAAGAALLVAAALRSMGPGPAQGHVAQSLPGSRPYLCYVDAHQPDGQIQPTNSACRSALEAGGAEAFYDWFGVLRADGQGRTRGFIPDGALCSAGLSKFAGFDAPHSDWPVTHLSQGANLQHGNRVAYAGWFSLFVTRDGYQSNRPLTWNDIEPEPFYSAATPPGAVLPHKTGRHIIYSVWTRENSHETFYGCSDVIFDGGGGEVSGIRSVASQPVPGPGGEG